MRTKVRQQDDLSPMCLSISSKTFNLIILRLLLLFFPLGITGPFTLLSHSFRQTTLNEDVLVTYLFGFGVFRCSTVDMGSSN